MLLLEAYVVLEVVLHHFHELFALVFYLVGACKRKVGVFGLCILVDKLVSELVSKCLELIVALDKLVFDQNARKLLL